MFYSKQNSGTYASSLPRYIHTSLHLTGNPRVGQRLRVRLAKYAGFFYRRYFGYLFKWPDEVLSFIEILVELDYYFAELCVLKILAKLAPTYFVFCLSIPKF